MKPTKRPSQTGVRKRRDPKRPAKFDELLDEAYLLILTRRPAASELARQLRVPKTVLHRVLRRLSDELKTFGLRVGSAGTGKKKTLQVEALGEREGTPVAIGRDTLAVRQLPRQRPGLKPEDEIIYARDW
jgi:hypothetical protein